MPRYDDRDGRDRYSNTRLYVGRISSRTRSHDLEDFFGRYGRVRYVDLKRDFAFVEFSDPRDADDAQYNLDGRELDGSRIIVEFARGGPRGAGGSRDHGGSRGPPPGSGRCFNCGLDGHWARDCKAGDWKNKCYRCGERGHIERNCQNSPKDLKRGRSYSRSPTQRSRSRSYSRGRSYSRSITPRRDSRADYSPSPKRERSPVRDASRSPPPKKRDASRSPPPKKRDASRSPPPKKRGDSNGSDYGGSPNGDGGHSNGRSPSPRYCEDNNGNHRASPRGSESPEN